jgi:uncharacterized protein
MSTRDVYEPGVPCWVETIQPDMAAAATFYGTLFGWEPVSSGVTRGETEYVVARLRGRDVAGIVPMPPMVSPPPQPGWVTHVRVARIEEAAERVVAAGGSVVLAPFEAPPAGRLGVMTDPAGAAFCVWEPERRQGAQLVNEPGAWAMSHLASPDPERASAFYGDLFGWTVESFGEGDAAITMFRLPGYVGGEPEQPVSREVVATMSAAPGNGAAGWGVNLWDRDVDATAAEAAELGGRVLAAPFDTPMSRMAVLADPHGAPFSISTVPG